ncbi:hypothetical protein [Acinetobacter sp. 251-1]|uniref:hypothetical protein n=1 Tax=Acinetobacter sp. 251-1 TaxID=2746720 RepID=UPI00257771AA|nr:hypothetical protein [Acinetobacter sp. 251-1]MDM1760236.1 hypothetical protein [Acinetobacter sp. 251-1]
MIDENRENYATIKSWLLETYFDACRDLSIQKKWSHLEILGYTFYQFENSFELPIEKFMLFIAELILTANWDEALRKNIMYQVEVLIQENNFKSILEYFSEDEREEFLRDLSVLNISI